MKGDIHFLTNKWTVLNYLFNIALLTDIGVIHDTTDRVISYSRYNEACYSEARLYNHDYHIIHHGKQYK